MLLPGLMMVVASLKGTLITKVSGLVGQYFSESSSSIEEKIEVGIGTGSKPVMMMLVRGVAGLRGALMTMVSNL